MKLKSSHLMGCLYIFCDYAERNRSSQTVVAASLGVTKHRFCEVCCFVEVVYLDMIVQMISRIIFFLKLEIAKRKT